MGPKANRISAIHYLRISVNNELRRNITTDNHMLDLLVIPFSRLEHDQIY